MNSARQTICRAFFGVQIGLFERQISELSKQSAVCRDFYRISSSSFHQTASNSSLPAASDPEDDPSEQRSPPSDRVIRLVDEISGLTLLEVSDLSRCLKKKLGLPMVPMGAMMGMSGGYPGGHPGAAGGGAAPAAAAEEPAAPEKTIFDVKLEKFDAAVKLKVIKEVRAITGLGLKESKDLVEQAPAVIKKGVSKEEAESILEKLKAVGAACEME